MIGINFVICEAFSSYVPDKHKETLADVDWEETHFATPSICRDNFLMEYDITEDGSIYEKDPDNGEIEKIEYTGEIEMTAAVLKDKHDYEVTARALFFKGELKEFEFLNSRELDNERRKEAVEEAQELALQYVKREGSLWFRFVSFTLGCARLFLGWIIKTLWVIQSKIT